MTLSRRSALLLLAAGAWTLYVWVTRLWIMAGQDESVGFKVVHGVLAIVSIAFGLAVGRLGWRAVRESRSAPTDTERAGSPERSSA